MKINTCNCIFLAIIARFRALDQRSDKTTYDGKNALHTAVDLLTLDVRCVRVLASWSFISRDVAFICISTFFKPFTRIINLQGKLYCAIVPNVSN